MAKTCSCSSFANSNKIYKIIFSRYTGAIKRYSARDFVFEPKMSQSHTDNKQTRNGQNPWNGWSLSHKSAVVIIPPEHCWPQIQQIRSKYDKAYVRWMPHINLIYPFIECSPDGRSFVEATDAAMKALTGLQPFLVRFSTNSFRCFQHGPKSCTLWLKPETEKHAGTEANSLFDHGNMHEDIMELQRRLNSIFNVAIDCGGGSRGRRFTPHLSVGQFKPQNVMSHTADFRSGWSEIEFEVSEIAIIARDGQTDSMSIRRLVKFGGDGHVLPVELVPCGDGSKEVDLSHAIRVAEDEKANSNLMDKSSEATTLRCGESGTEESASVQAKVENVSWQAELNGVTWGAILGLKFS